ncbi:MAG TPA: Ppx/GppA phosphatase family protein [Thermoanaerobaculia bacterium]|nr:Ppx/GppA phosphatase family protein [Thermoanaerobaculia bacterium]
MSIAAAESGVERPFRVSEPSLPAADSTEGRKRRTHRPQRIAAIDVGTNSIHMIIVEARRHGYRVIDKEKEMVQLGRDSLEGRPLTDDAIERGVSTLRSMADIARRWGVDEIVAVATSAIREAPNRRQFLSAARKASGISIRVISGEEEADYIYRAVRSAVDFHDGTALSIDIGGGSVEFIVGTQNEVFFTRSEPLGALRMAQRFDLEKGSTSTAIAECRSFVRKTIRKAIARISSYGFDFAIGSSGTIVTLATLSATTGAGDGMQSGLRWLSRTRLGELIEALTPLSLAERSKRFALDEKRAATILGGALVLDEIMRGLEMEQLRACDAAIREGIVEHFLDQRRSSDAAPRGSIRRSSVRSLAERSGVERAHASQVARLALRIFDQLAEIHQLSTGERELLEYAALLHEVGMHVSYQAHHKHSYYLISHAGLRGFTGDQVAVVANVARYVRKSPPTEDHQNFADLSKAQQNVVLRLAAILRVADALDRGRHGVIRDVAVVAGKRRIHLELRPRDEADVELAAATKRAKYLGRVFERKVDLTLV